MGKEMERNQMGEDRVNKGMGRERGEEVRGALICSYIEFRLKYCSSIII